MTDPATDNEFPKIVSVDDHIVEPKNLWQDRLPKQYLDIGPRVYSQGVGEMSYVGGRFKVTADDDGTPCDWWAYEDLRLPMTRVMAAAGFPREEVQVVPITFDEMRPGCYDRDARLEDMDTAWIEASLNYPTFPRFCGQTFSEAKDKDLALLCVQAYNDWTVEDWCAPSGGRLIPMCLIPLWDPEAAAVEVRRNADRGVRAVCFSEIPPNLGLPSIHDADGHWDPFFAACEETGTVIGMHIGSGSKMPSTSRDAPGAVGSTATFTNAMLSLCDWLFSGVLVRYPELQIAYAESQIGWIPYILERADHVWEENRAWGGVADIVPEPPSTYFHRQVYGCFFSDQFGLENLEAIGVDRVTFESDYPHSDSTWPDTKQVAMDMTKHLSHEVTEQIVRGNAIRMLGLDL